MLACTAYGMVAYEHSYVSARGPSWYMILTELKLLPFGKVTPDINMYH